MITDNTPNTLFSIRNHCPLEIMVYHMRPWEEISSDHIPIMADLLMQQSAIMTEKKVVMAILNNFLE